MRKIIQLLLPAFLLILLFSFSGCSVFSKSESEGEASASAYEAIQNKLISMKTYETDAKVKYISNKNQNEYDTHQMAKSTGEYRIEITGPETVAGNITMSDGATICQYNEKVSSKVSVGTKESQERSEILLTSFLKNYLTSQEVSVSVASMEEGKATVLEAKVPGEHPYLATEKLWVDNTTHLPLQLIVYDADGSERIIITYANFQYDVELDSSLFTVAELEKAN